RGDRANRTARPAAEAPARANAGQLRERHAVLLGPGGAGQPGRLAAVRPGAARAAPGTLDRDHAHLAPSDVGPGVGFVKGARRRAAGDPRHRVRLAPGDIRDRWYRLTSRQLPILGRVFMRGFAGKVP